MNGEYAVAAPAPGTSSDDWAVLTARVPLVAATMQGFLAQQAVTLAPATIVAFNEVLRRFGLWLSEHNPDVAGIADVTRAHIEAFKIKCSTDTHSLTGSRWLSTRSGDDSGC